MNLAQLIKILDLPIEATTDISSHNLPKAITSIHYRSQETRPGGVFVAIRGFSADGHRYIEDAVRRGAAAIIAQRSIAAPVPVLVVDDTRKALARAAAEFYGYPAYDMRMVGITGTSGKTTVTYLLESIFSAAGFRCGVIGTINYRYAGHVFPNPVTTPESLDLQRILADMKKAGVTHVAMEISSHALDLNRVDHCDLDIGVFTNLSQDHLDYHKNMESYWVCKKRLFHEHLKPAGTSGTQAQAIINCDYSYGSQLYKELTVAKLSTGTQENATIRPVDLQMSQSGITAEISMPSGNLTVASKLVGRHNLENILSAIGAATAMGVAPKAIEKGIKNLQSIPGRLESVPNDKNRYVYIDYAHKPDALSNVLTTLRPLLAGRLICVMGCGGDRDQTKRPIMGEIAAQLADLTIVTSDNPRTEPPEKIIDQIITGVRRNGGHEYRPQDLINGFSEKGFVIEADRRSAIRLAVAISKPKDTILVAGKGHETYQILGDRTIDFDDVLEAKSALTARGADQ